MRLRKDIVEKIFTVAILAAATVLLVVQAGFIIGLRREVEREKEMRTAVEQALQLTNEKKDVLAEQISQLQDTVYDYETHMLVADDAQLAGLRSDLFSRQELIPNLYEDGRENPYRFPAADRREWLLPLNLDLGYTAETGEYLFYARAMRDGSNQSMDMLFALPYDRTLDEPKTDHKGRVQWRCVAYNRGKGWQLAEEDEEKGKE